ncbi:MAG TPA: hypothetical protein VK555_06740, partial [Terriglobales bacterium]|nr:hypothetical protein [Terriglobales bacterium]
TFNLQTVPYNRTFVSGSLMASVVVPWVFLLTALTIFLLRRNDGQVQLLAVMLGSFIFDGPFESAGVAQIALWTFVVGGVWLLPYPFRPSYTSF